MGDSLRVQWDGLDAAGQMPPVARVLLRVASRAPTGELAGIVQLPLDLRVVHVDTLPWPKPPADSLLLPEHSGSRPALRALLGGALLATTVAALPSVVGGDHPSGSRLVVAGTVGLAGALGYVLHRPGRPLTVNIQANQALRARWQQGVAAVKAENVGRRVARCPARALAQARGGPPRPVVHAHRRDAAALGVLGAARARLGCVRRLGGTRLCGAVARPVRQRERAGVVRPRARGRGRDGRASGARAARAAAGIPHRSRDAGRWHAVGNGRWRGDRRRAVGPLE